MARAEEQALAPQAREWPQEFLRSCMNVAPVVLEQAGIGREHGEQFLQYLQQPEVLAQIQNAPGVRERLGPVLAHFYRAVDFQREEKIEAGSNQAAVDRLLWQVAVALVRQSQYGAGRAILEEVHRAVSNPAIDKPAIADWTRAEHSALGESTRQPGQEEGAVRAEHRLAQMYRILTS